MAIHSSTLAWKIPGTEESGGLQSAAAAAAKSLQSCPTLCDPRDGSLPRSSISGILQARTLEWVAISFSIFQHEPAPTCWKLTLPESGGFYN